MSKLDIYKSILNKTQELNKSTNEVGKLVGDLMLLFSQLSDQAGEVLALAFSEMNPHPETHMAITLFENQNQAGRVVDQFYLMIIPEDIETKVLLASVDRGKRFKSAIAISRKSNIEKRWNNDR